MIKWITLLFKYLIWREKKNKKHDMKMEWLERKTLLETIIYREKIACDLAAIKTNKLLHEKRLIFQELLTKIRCYERSIANISFDICDNNSVRFSDLHLVYIDSRNLLIDFFLQNESILGKDIFACFEEYRKNIREYDFTYHLIKQDLLSTDQQILTLPRLEIEQGWISKKMEIALKTEG